MDASRDNTIDPLRSRQPANDQPWWREQRTRPALTVLWLLFILLVGQLDLWTGNELSMSLFYLVPVLGAAYLQGTGSALLVASVASFMWFGADFSAREPGELWLSLWNWFTRFVTYVGVGWLMARVVADRAQLHEAWAREHMLSPDAHGLGVRSANRGPRTW